MWSITLHYPVVLKISKLTEYLEPPGIFPFSRSELPLLLVPLFSICPSVYTSELFCQAVLTFLCVKQQKSGLIKPFYNNIFLFACLIFNQFRQLTHSICYSGLTFILRCVYYPQIVRFCCLWRGRPRDFCKNLCLNNLEKLFRGERKGVWYGYRRLRIKRR